jgi:hypothetical protein
VASGGLSIRSYRNDLLRHKQMAVARLSAPDVHRRLKTTLFVLSQKRLIAVLCILDRFLQKWKQKTKGRQILPGRQNNGTLMIGTGYGVAAVV